MTILLIGKSGQIGYELERSLRGDVCALDYPEIDLCKPDTYRGIIQEIKPAVIINAAAYTAVDKAEIEVEKTMAINAEAPRILAEEAKRLGALLVHYSTDYVYNGTKEGLYTEQDQPNPMGVYAKSKLEGDQAIMAVAPNYIILRTSWVYGSRGSNFLLTMLRLASEGRSLRVIDDQIGAPTWCRHIAQATVKIVEAVKGKDIQELYHITNSGKTSWFGFAQAIFEEAGLKPPLTPIPTTEYPTPAKRPMNSQLDLSKLAKDFGIVMPHWHNAMVECMQEVPLLTTR